MIKKLIKKLKTPVYNKWYLNIKLGEFVEILQETSDCISETHLGKPRKYWAKLYPDKPYKYELVLFDEFGKILVSFTIPEMLDMLDCRPPRYCYNYILDKIKTNEQNSNYKS